MGLLRMNYDTEIEFGEPDDEEESPLEIVSADPDEFLLNNAFRIVYQTSNFMLPQIRSMIDDGTALNLRPEYQRRLRWSGVQKSKLIESLLLNIPVPPVFFYETDAAHYEVMDGQQRLNTIREFFEGNFSLRGLKILHPLNGLRYPSAPPRVKRTLDRASLSAIILLMESEAERPSKGELSLSDIRRIVFDRLNTGGKRLNAQELRNAQNPGNFNDGIIDISRLKIFTEIFGIPPYSEKNPEEYYTNPERQKNSLYSSMRDCELALRFFALRDAENVRGAMRSMLDRAMAKKISKDEKEVMVESYRERLQFLYDLFNGKPFQIKTLSDGKPKVSAAIYDSAMVSIDRMWNRRAEIYENKEYIHNKMDLAINDDEKYEILIGRGNTAEHIRSRIKLMSEVLSPESK